MSAQTIAPPPQSAMTQPRAGPERRVELDWLRTIVVLGIIPFHAVMIFAVSNAIFVRSASASPQMAVIGSFIDAWGIPVIFLMAGAATRLALDHRSAGAYVRERFAHLVVPLALVVLLLAPLQAYFILLSNPSLLAMGSSYGFAIAGLSPEQLGNIGTFFQVYYTYLVTSVHQLSPATSNLVLGQLWFVPRLLVVSLICLPLFLYLRSQGQRWVERLASVGAHPAALLIGAGLVPAVLVALLQTGWLDRVTGGWPYTDDWAVFFLDLVIFVYGYLIYSSTRLRDAVRGQYIPALVLGAVCTVIVVVVLTRGDVPANDYTPASLLFALAKTFAAWLPALALLGLALRFLTVSTAWQRYLTPAAFPVYLLHTSLLAISAYYLLMLPLPWLLQLLLIITVTMAGAFALYEYVLRRTPVTRFLFGIKAPRARVRAQPKPPAASSKSSGGSAIA